MTSNDEQPMETEDDQQQQQHGQPENGGTVASNGGKGDPQPTRRTARTKPPPSNLPGQAGGSGGQPVRGAFNLRSGTMAIRAARDRIAASAGGLAGRLAEARDLLDSDFSTGEAREHIIQLNGMEDSLREASDVFQQLLDQAVDMAEESDPDQREYWYGVVMAPLPRTARTLGVQGDPNPTELLQLAAEHLTDLRVVRRPLEQEDRESALTFSSRSRATGSSQPLGDVFPAPGGQQPAGEPKPEQHSGNGQVGPRVGTPLRRRLANLLQRNREPGPRNSVQAWVQQVQPPRAGGISPRAPHQHTYQPIRGGHRSPIRRRSDSRAMGATTFETVRLQPPTFSGKPEDWSTFWVYFKRAVDDRPIPGFEKQLHLLRCLKEGSPARRAVEVYPPSDGNYPVVVQLLKERFGNTADLQRAIRAQLLHLAPAKDNVSSLTTTIDEFERGMSQLEQLGANADDDSFVPLLETKLPIRILTELRIQEGRNGAQWTTREFRRAVTAHVRYMRSAESALAAMKEPERRHEQRPEGERRRDYRQELERTGHGNRAGREQFQRAFLVRDNLPGPQRTPDAPVGRAGAPPPNQRPGARHENDQRGASRAIGVPPRASNGLLGDFPGPCSLCQTTGHRPSGCPTYPTAQTRRQRVVDQGRCLRCLAPGHNASQCRRERPCRWCQRDDHHTLICWNRPATEGTPEAPTRDPNTPIRAMLVQNSTTGNRGTPPGAIKRRQRRDKRRAKRNREGTRAPQQHNHSGEPDPPDDKRAFAMLGHRLPAYLMVCPVIAAAEGNDSECPTTLLLDPGSHVDCAEAALIRQLKPARTGRRPLTVQVFGGDKKRIKSATYRVRLKRTDGAWESLEVSEVPQICTPIRTELIRPGSSPDDGLTTTTVTTQPQILIGIRKFWDYVISFRKSDQGAYLIDTVFGTVFCGEHFQAVCGWQPAAPVFSIMPCGEDERDQMPAVKAVEQFWSMEAIGINDDPTDDADTEAVIQFERSVRQLPDGRYSIRLPWRESHPELPSNFSVAYRRLATMLTRLQRLPEVLKQYTAVIDEQRQNGIIEETTIGGGLREHFIPHQAVITPKKLRVVYDASAHLKGMPSLNDCLLRGPVWLPDLAGMLLRFRACRVPVIADVEKAFLMVAIEEEERDVCKFLWVRDPTQPLTTHNLAPYRFRRLAFGLTPSPFCLAAVVRHHLRKYDSELAEQLIRDTYVDNVLIPAESIEEAAAKAREAKRMFGDARMNLREFLSNDKALNDSFPEADFIGKTTAKVLGIEWDAENDHMRMYYPGDTPGAVSSNTRRGVLKVIASMFDPLGLSAPATLNAKCFFQKLWDSTHDWDTPLESEDARDWQAILASWAGVTTTIPRKVPAGGGQPLELHVFTDASEVAYAAAAYLRIDGPNGSESRLIMAKSRLKPKKAATTFTIPRMELMGLLLGTRLATFIKSQLHQPVAGEHVWSDSMIALHWIRNRNPQPQFVANRLLEIRRSTATIFHYVRTGENPADLATRGVNPAALQTNTLWWSGPEWLNQSGGNWPRELEFTADPDDREPLPAEGHDGTAFLARDETIPDQDREFPSGLLHRCSRWTRAQRTTAWMLRFINNVRMGRQPGDDAEPDGTGAEENHGVIIPARKDTVIRGKMVPPLQVSELQTATTAIIRGVQQQSQLPGGVRTGLDPGGVQRLISRIGQCEEPEISRPIILPKKSRVAALLIDDVHVRFHHVGVEGTLAEFLRGWWIPGARQQVRRVIGQCRSCRRMKGIPYSLPPMPPLPADRVQRRRPFESVGLDYLGPTMALDENGTGRKAWVLLITCLTTRAIYIDATRDLSAASFIAVLRRFIARRGVPTRILSDNAPTFTVVGKTLTDFGIAGGDPIAFADARGIQWRFTPQHTPWAGGVFERAVQLVKRALQKTLGGTVLCYDALATLLAEIEATVNSRPLTYVNSSAGDPQPLRPIDFIQENNRLWVDPPTVPEPPRRAPREPPHVQLTRQWRDSQQRIDHFWKRWHREYLLALREKAGWNHPARRVNAPGSPKIGDVVLVEDKFHARNLWAMGRIVEVKGSGGQIRSVMIRMPNGRVWGRPVNKISPLEEAPENDSDWNQPNSGADPAPEVRTVQDTQRPEEREKGPKAPATGEGSPRDNPATARVQSPEARAVQGAEVRRTGRARKERVIWSPERQVRRAGIHRLPRIGLGLLALIMCCMGTFGCQPAIRPAMLDVALSAAPSTGPPCTMRCTARGVTTTGNRKLDKLEICCPDGCWATTPRATETNYDLPAEELIHEYHCSGQCWWGNEPPHNMSQRCPARAECDLISCLLCWEQLANPTCNPRWVSTLFGLGMGLLLAILGCVCPILGRCWAGATLFSKAVAWGARYPIGLINRITGRNIPAPTTSQVERKVRQGVRAAREEVRAVQQRLQLARRARAMARAWRNPGQGRRVTTGSALIGILPILLLLGGAMATRPLSVAVRSEDCARTPAGLKCAGTAATIITLLPADQTTSFIIRTQQDELLGAVRLRLASITMVCTPRTESWLRSYAISTTAVKRCPAAGSCTGRLCGLVNSGRRESIPELSDLNHRPGHSKCLHSSGFWGHTCALPQSACLFYRWAAVPLSSTVFEEFSCLEWDLQISTWVGLETNNGQTDFQQVILHPGVPEKWGNMTLAVIPTSLPPMPALSAHFITDGRSVAMGKPIPSDLHCADEAMARDFDRCQMAVGACHHCAPNHDNGSIHCHCKDLDLEQVINDPEHRLPLDVARLHLHNDGSAVRAEFQYSPVQVRVQLHGVELVSEYSDTKCWVERPTLSGCYRCVTGATLNATCRTDHGSALAQITCTDGTAFALHCGGNDSTTTEAIPFDRAEVSTECRVKCPAGVTTFCLQGELAFIPRHQQFGFNQRDSSGGHISPGSGFSLPDWGIDPFPLLRLLMGGPWLLAALGAGVIALCALYLVVKFNPHFRLYRALITAGSVALAITAAGASGAHGAATATIHGKGVPLSPVLLGPLGCRGMAREILPQLPSLSAYPPVTPAANGGRPSPRAVLPGGARHNPFLLTPGPRGTGSDTRAGEGERPGRVYQSAKGGGSPATDRRTHGEANPLPFLPIWPPAQQSESFFTNFPSGKHTRLSDQMADWTNSDNGFANGGFDRPGSRTRSGSPHPGRNGSTYHRGGGPEDPPSGHSASRNPPLSQRRRLGRAKSLPPKADVPTVATEIEQLGVDEWGTDPWQRTTVEAFLRDQERLGRRMVHERTGEIVPVPSVIGLLPASKQLVAPGWAVSRYYAADRQRPLRHPEWPCIHLSGGIVGSSRKSRAKQAGGWRPWRYLSQHCDWVPVEELRFAWQADIDREEMEEMDGAPVRLEDLGDPAGNPPEQHHQQQHHQQQHHQQQHHQQQHHQQQHHQRQHHHQQPHYPQQQSPPSVFWAGQATRTPNINGVMQRERAGPPPTPSPAISLHSSLHNFSNDPLGEPPRRLRPPPPSHNWTSTPNPGFRSEMSFNNGSGFDWGRKKETGDERDGRRRQQAVRLGDEADELRHRYEQLLRDGRTSAGRLQNLRDYLAEVQAHARRVVRKLPVADQQVLGHRYRWLDHIQQRQQVAAPSDPGEPGTSRSSGGGPPGTGALPQPIPGGGDQLERRLRESEARIKRDMERMLEEERRKDKAEREAARLQTANELRQMLAEAKWTGMPPRASDKGGRATTSATTERSTPPKGSKNREDEDALSLAGTGEEDGGGWGPRGTVANSDEKQKGTSGAFPRGHRGGVLTFSRRADGNLEANELDTDSEAELGGGIRDHPPAPGRRSRPKKRR